MNERTVKFNTLCRDCIFAEFSDAHTLQTGCQLGRLSKFQDKDKATLIQDKETGLEYYDIGTICNTCRDSTNVMTKEEVLNQIQIECDYIILDDSRLDWEESALKTAESFLSHTILPTRIIFGFYHKRVMFNSFNQKVKNLIKDKPIDYDIVNILEPVHDSWRLIDILARKVKSAYFSLCELDGRLPTTWIEQINKHINIDLNSLSLIQPISGLTGLTVQNLLYKTLGGSEGSSIIDKVEHLAEEQQLQSMIKHWDEL